MPVTSALGGTTSAIPDTLHVGGAGHFDLLNHPTVYLAISALLEHPAPPPVPRSEPSA